MSELLTVRGLRSGYQAVLGRNGVGRTTLVSTLMGLVRPYAGSVRLVGEEIARTATDRIARRGVALVSQGRRVFAPLTVAEHLSIARGRDLVRSVCEQGMSVLLVEQDLRLAFSVSGRVAVLQKGRVAHSSTTSDFRAQPELAHSLLGFG